METIAAKFDINKILGWLKGFLKSMPSPVSGFNIQDAKVKQEGDVFSSMFQLETSNLTDGATGDAITDISGNKINLSILLKVLNAKQVFNPILTGLNNMAQASKEDNDALLQVLLGKDYGGDLSIGKAQDRGSAGGLLGADFSKFKDLINQPKITYKGTTYTWISLANDAFMYGLECQAPGKTHGAIENQSLQSCSKLISEYLVLVGVITSESEVNVDPYALVLPLLARMHGWLCNYYMSAIAKYDDLKLPDDESESSKVNPEDTTEETEQNPTMDVDQNAEDTSLFDTKQIKVTLKKIQGSDDIDLLGLQSTYAPTDTLNYVDDIINQAEFLDALTEEPQSFNIQVDDEGYAIEQCELCEIDPCESLSEILRQGIRFYRNLYIIHWMAKGNDMMKTHLLSEEMYGELIQEIDTLGELLVEKCGSVVPLDFECAYLDIRPYEFQESLDILKSYINMYIDTIDYAYPNQTSDVQSTLDEWLRYWNKQMNYFVKGQEE